MIVAYTCGGGRDVFKAGIFFRSEVLKRIGCWFESCRPWLRHFRLRWDTTHGSTPTTSSADALYLCRSQRSDQMPSCLQGESLPQFDIPYGKYVRHWDTETLTRNVWIGSVARHWRHLTARWHVSDWAFMYHQKLTHMENWNHSLLFMVWQVQNSLRWISSIALPQKSPRWGTPSSDSVQQQCRTLAGSPAPRRPQIPNILAIVIPVNSYAGFHKFW
jgi:hypothetical protein